MYRAAFNLTIAVVNQRSRIFRNQVAAVVAVALCSVVGAITLRMFWPLTGLLALAPVCGLFLWADTRQVAYWRSAILAMWALLHIDLLTFSHAMRANTILPVATLSSMLSMLGTSQIGPLEVQASAQTRQAVAAVVRFADALGLRQLAVKVCTTAIVSISICWAAVANAWWPLALTTTILLLPLIQRWLQVSLQRQSRAAVLAAHQHPDFDANTFRLLMDHLPLEGGQASMAHWTDLESANRRTAAPSA